MNDLLPDLFDHFDGELSLLSAKFKQYGKRDIFWGEVVTIQCFEDNSKVKQILATEGKGKVLVVDGDASMDKALLGDLIALSAVDNGWEGVVINGCVRDVGALKKMDLGIKALGENPIKTVKLDRGEVNISLEMDSVIIEPGMMLYSDENGIAIAPKALDLSFLL